VTGVELVVTDLDSTFWTGHEDVHPAHIEAWAELERRGIAVMVATGRRVGSTRVPLARHGLAPAAVVLNGAIVLDLADDRRVHRQMHSPDAASAVLDAFRAAGLEPCVYVDHPEVAVFCGDAPSTHPGHYESFGADVGHDDLEVVVAREPVLMFGLLGHDGGRFESLHESLAGVAIVHTASDDQWGGYSCTVTPLGLSKWVGVEAYCRDVGLDSTRVLAVGDGPNDVELLSAAAVSVAPAGATPLALAAAEHRIPSPREGGWAKILELV
jgi:hydroxymethylpyrimidine pyrophosphatase-like HAD family hydrolase